MVPNRSTVAAIQALDRLGALADGGAHAVHCRVAPADDDDVAALGVEFTAVEFRYYIAESFSVAGCEVGHSRINAVERCTGQADVARLVDAGGY